MNKNDLKKLIESDLYRYSGKVSFETFLKNTTRNPGFKYTYALRKCQFHKEKNKVKYYFYRYLLRKYTYKYGYEIPDSVKMGSGIYINHLGGIAINPAVVFGDNINLTKGVTIGQANRGTRKGVPVIGSCVWIGANATIVGKIEIGNNVLICPNSYVNFDVPSDSVVMGNPAQIIANGKATDRYIVRTDY